MAAEKKILCFDLDGTLIDSGEAHAHAFNLAFKKNNLDTQQTEKIIKSLGPTSDIIVKSFFPTISGRKLEQTIKDHHEFLAKETVERIKPIADAAFALTELKEHYKLVVVSNAEKRVVSILLRKAGIDPKLFDLIISKEDMPHPKPFPDSLKKVESVLKGHIDYYVGDTIYDVRAGKAAGVKTIAVLSGVHDIDQLGGEEPTMIIKDVSILPEILFKRI